MLAGLALLLAVSVTADPVTGAVAVRTDPGGNSLDEVLQALRAATRVNYIADGFGEGLGRVDLDACYASRDEAIHEIGAACGRLVEEQGGIYLLRMRPWSGGPGERSGETTPAAKFDGADRYRVPGHLSYAIQLLPESEAHAAARQEWGGFERRKDCALVVAPSIKAQAIREYLEARAAIRPVLEAGGLDIPLRGDLDHRSARVYLQAEKNRYLVEVLYSMGERGAEIAHFVYVVDAKSLACDVLYVFKTRA